MEARLTTLEQGLKAESEGRLKVQRKLTEQLARLQEGRAAAPSWRSGFAKMSRRSAPSMALDARSTRSCCAFGRQVNNLQLRLSSVAGRDGSTACSPAPPADRKVKGVRAGVGGERPYEMKLRTFFALPVPDRVARPLSDCADTLYLYDRGLDAHWVDSANYHLTLCFTGEVTLDQVTELERSCRERLPHQRGFSLQLERLAYFKVNARLAILAAWWVRVNR